VNIPLSVIPFWTRFVATRNHDPSSRFYEAFHFDDNAKSADELADLVLSGRKRATAALVWEFDERDKPIPKPGDLSIVTRFSGEPVCVIETARVQVVPFNEVTARFAATEGEGDGTLEYWRQVHTAYFGRECKRLGREFSADMPIVCEEFEVIFRASDGGAV
jgi:uncharacterized protein YhfF